eukprot:13040-Heterococcus_DN1.PRE.5
MDAIIVVGGHQLSQQRTYKDLATMDASCEQVVAPKAVTCLTQLLHSPVHKLQTSSFCDVMTCAAS